MDQILEFKNWYLEKFKDFETQLNGEKNSSVHETRKDAMENFSKLSFPTVKDEEWRYTNIAPLLKYNFTQPEKLNLKKEEIEKYLFADFTPHLLVFINGIFAEELSHIKKLPAKAVAGSIASALKEKHPAAENHFGKYAKADSNIFTALSTAFIKDGAFLYIPDGAIIEEPVHILFLTKSGEEQIVSHPRNLIIAGKNSQVTVIEHYTGSSDNEIYFTNSVTEIVADENSVIDHIKLQEESKSAFHIAQMEVDQERSSNFSSHMISLGGSISRNDFNARFNDEGSECTLNGLYMIDGTQLFDAHTLIDHAKPHCNSHEHYKGLLDGKSRGVFNGKVMVRKDAQKTNAFQENNNIILSTEALVNTKPQLEIFADDVKCSHGATIGQLDSNSMFYLKSRGIGEDSARAILIHAFASDVATSIKIKPVRDYLEDILTNKFNPDMS
jgi:Fe-S cluster assembly protein SufD